MKTKYVLFLFSMIMVALLNSCKSSAPFQETETTSKIITKTETIHDTVFEIKADSSFYKAYIECINNKPVITGYTDHAGTYLEVPKVQIIHDTLKVDCEARAQELLAQYKDTHTHETIETVRKVLVEVEKNLTLWQKFQIWCGRVFLLIIVAFAAYKVLQFKKLI